MRIPGRKLERFVRELCDECLTSQVARTTQCQTMTSYALSGAENAQAAALYNKTYEYLDNTQSLLYSPVSLRYHIADPDVPSILEEAKGRAAASRLRGYARRSDTDTRISDAVWWSLVKGKCFLKSAYKRGMMTTTLVQPETFGVRHETHNQLDEDMEAFCHAQLISFEQYARIIWDHPDRENLLRRGRQYVRPFEGGPLPSSGADKQVITGGLYPFQPAGSMAPNKTRGIVDWMGGPKPILAPSVERALIDLYELWVWDDDRQDWTTFQIIGNDILITPKTHLINTFAYDKETRQSTPALRGRHPFSEFCVNPIDGYFWGRSEILNVAMLQEAINSRLTGINKMLRMQEQPTKRFLGTSVNQLAWSRYNKPGGYYADTNPNAKIETDRIEIPDSLWASLHEYERMFDEMGGLPPLARGRGDAGVRSNNHAETLVRMFSPRFKDRALLIERDVEANGGLHLDMGKAHVDKKMIAWVPPEAAGELATNPAPLMVPPTKGFVPVFFGFSDLSEDATLTVDSHSSSPAFAAEARALAFDLVKVGAYSAEDVVRKVDVTDPDEAVAGIQRRAAAAAEANQRAETLKLVSHMKK